MAGPHGLRQTVLQMQTSMALMQLEHQTQNRKLKHEVKKLQRRLSPTRRRSSLVWNIFIVLPCLVGCLYQAYQITEVYLKHEVTAESLFYPGKEIVSPMVIICTFNESTFIHEVLNTTELFEVSDSFLSVVSIPRYDRDLIQERSNRQAHLSMRQFAERYVTTFVINGMVCYAINYARDFFTNYTFMDARASLTSVNIQMYVGNDDCLSTLNCQAYITQPRYFNVKSHSGKPLLPNTHVKLSYQKQELNLLPPPYTTDCFDYPRYGIRSQEECISTFERIYLKQNNITLMSRFVLVMEGEDLSVNLTKIRPSEWALEQCARTPCRLEQFYVYDSMKLGLYQNDTLLSLMFPTNGELIVNYKPKITLWEYLTLFGSVFGLWLGLNGLAIAGLVELAVRECF